MYLGRQIQHLLQKKEGEGGEEKCELIRISVSTVEKFQWRTVSRGLRIFSSLWVPYLTDILFRIDLKSMSFYQSNFRNV